MRPSRCDRVGPRCAVGKLGLHVSGERRLGDSGLGSAPRHRRIWGRWFDFRAVPGFCDTSCRGFGGDLGLCRSLGRGVGVSVSGRAPGSARHGGSGMFMPGCPGSKKNVRCWREMV